jgi:hypothetical protein
LSDYRSKLAVNSFFEELAMAEESSLVASFLKGLGVLVGGLVLFVSEQYIQHRYWPDKPPSPPIATPTNNPPTAPRNIPIAGRVVDAAGTRLIENAAVHLIVGLSHEDQNTDSEGRYAFSLQGFDRNTAASMSIIAQGYKPLSVNFLLNARAEDQDLKLEAQDPTAPVQPSGTQNQTAPVNPRLAAIAKYVGPQQGSAPGTVTPSIRYVRRIDPKVIIAH